MTLSKRVWLQRTVTENERGHLQLVGDCGTERVVVELDPSVGAAGRDAVLAMHGQVERAAQRKFEQGEAYPVYRSDELVHRLIAITDQDLVA